MRCVDVNVLVYAHRVEAENHERYVAWLDEARTSAEPLGLSDVVLAGFVRVVTHPRVFKDPTPLQMAFAFADALRSAPSVLAVQPGLRHWDIFERLCAAAEAHGNLVPDAFLAALAIEQGADWYSADRAFARFPGLRWHHPLED